MPPFFRPACLLLLAALGFAPVPAMAQAASPDRCDGLLCDLFHRGEAAPAPAAAPAPQQPTAAIQPSNGSLLGGLFGGNGSSGGQRAAAPASPGLIAAARGAPEERCGGTVCDLFYGGPSPAEIRAEHPELAQQPGAAAASAPQEGYDAPRPARQREAYEETPPPQKKPGCVAPASDPWRCYR